MVRCWLDHIHGTSRPEPKAGSPSHCPRRWVSRPIPTISWQSQTATITIMPSKHKDLVRQSRTDIYTRTREAACIQLRWELGQLLHGKIRTISETSSLLLSSIILELQSAFTVGVQG